MLRRKRMNRIEPRKTTSRCRGNPDTEARQLWMSASVSLCLCGLLAFLIGCGEKPSVSPSRQKVRLQLNWKPEPQFGGFYAAKEIAGKHGIDLEVVPDGVGTRTVQMVLAGKAAVAVVGAH